MKRLRSHFWYSRTQRNGILFLIITIIISQFLFHFVEFPSQKKIDSSKVAFIRAKLDSLSNFSKENTKKNIKKKIKANLNKNRKKAFSVS